MKFFYILTVLLVFMAGQVSARESLFGISNKSLGLVEHPYASSGKARSYEVAHTDSMQLNYRNFAAWTDIAYTIFSVKAGYAGAFGENSVKSTYNDYANFRGGILAFPIQKKQMVLGLGVLPYTSIDQRIQEEFTTSDGEIEVFQNLIMRGGLSRAMLNFSVRLFSGYQFGLGYEYTFGKITENLVKELTENTTSRLFINYDYRYTGNGIVLSTLAQPIKDLKVGAVFRPSVKMNTKRVAESASDAVNEQVEGEMTLPAEFSFGFEYSFNPSYIAGMDLLYQDWKDGFKRNGSKESGQELLYRVGMGIERKPSERLFVSLTEQMSYRLGMFYGQLHYQKENEPVNEYGISMGFSLPIQRFRSGIDLSAIIGKRGSLSKNGLEETFVSFDITINASEIWFRNRED